MQVPQVDVVGLEELQGPVDGRRDVLGVSANVAAVGERPPQGHAELGGEEDLVPLAGPLEPRSALNDCERMSERKI